MTCSELLKLAPLYLSGEIEEGSRRKVTAHLAACPACEREIEQQFLLDARISAVFGQVPDASRVARAVRSRIGLPACPSAEGARRIAAVFATAAALVLLFVLTRAPRLYTDAAVDHQAEIVDRQPRHWRTATSEIEAAASQVGISFAKASALAPDGYTLERAKICGLDHVRALHLVFTNGVREYSAYVLPHSAATGNGRFVRQGTEQVAGVAAGRLMVLVVTGTPALNCRELARFAAARF